MKMTSYTSTTKKPSITISNIRIVRKELFLPFRRLLSHSQPKQSHETPARKYKPKPFELTSPFGRETSLIHSSFLYTILNNFNVESQQYVAQSPSTWVPIVQIATETSSDSPFEQCIQIQHHFKKKVLHLPIGHIYHDYKSDTLFTDYIQATYSSSR